MLFGKIISVAFLFGGYMLLGLYIGKSLVSKGYPPWFVPAGTLLGSLAGTLQAIGAIKDIIRRVKKN